MDLCIGCQIDWGSVADWVSGLATFGALVVVWRQQRQDHAKELQRTENERMTSEREQASKVCLWVGDPDPDNPPEVLRLHGLEHFAHLRKEVLYCHNGSNLPVYDVAVLSAKPAINGWIEPTGQRQHTIPPGKTLDFGSDVDPKSAHMTFRDAAGLWWGRSPDGNLAKMESNPYPEEDTAA